MGREHAIDECRRKEHTSPERPRDALNERYHAFERESINGRCLQRQVRAALEVHEDAFCNEVPAAAESRRTTPGCQHQVTCPFLCRRKKKDPSVNVRGHATTTYLVHPQRHMHPKAANSSSKQVRLFGIEDVR